MKKWLEDFATSIARPPEESRLLGDPISTRTKLAIFGFLFLVLLGIFIPATYMQFSQFNDFKVYAPLNRSDWKVAYLHVNNYEEVCNPLKEITALCPAHPDHPYPKETQFTRADPEHMKRTATRRNQVIWYFAEVNSSEVQELIDNEAFYLLMGRIIGDYDFWINGNRYVRVNLKGYDENVILPITSESLKDKQLFIAIRLIHNSGLVYPDMFRYMDPNGFLTKKESSTYELFDLFRAKISTWILFVIQLTLSLLFFFFWYSAKKKPEYAAMAFLLLCYSLNQVRVVHHIQNWFDGRTYHLFTLLFLYVIAMSIMYVGLSYARIKRSIIVTSFQAIGFIAFCSFCTAVFISIEGILKLELITFNYIIPISYLIGSLVTFSQAYVLIKVDKEKFKSRIKRLNTFSLISFAISMNFFIHLSVPGFSYFERYIFMALVLVLGYVILSEYRDQELIIEKSPLTEYHKHPHIGRIVKGVLFGLDLKKAEKLYLKRAKEGSEQTLVSEWRVAMIQSLKSKGALYLQSKGDEIFALIDEAKYKNTAQMTASILVDLKRESIEFRKRKIQTGELSEEDNHFDFRGAMIRGSLRPVFDTVDGKEYPEWEEAGDSMPFVDCGRLMALEKEIAQGLDNTQIILDQELAKDIDIDKLANGTLTFFDKDYQSKAHGKTYQIAGLLIDEDSPTNQSSTNLAS